MREVDAVLDQLDFGDAVVSAVDLTTRDIEIQISDLALTPNHPLNETGTHVWVKGCALVFLDVVFSQRSVYEYDQNGNPASKPTLITDQKLQPDGEPVIDFEFECFLGAPRAYMVWRICCASAHLRLSAASEFGRRSWAYRSGAP